MIQVLDHGYVKFIEEWGSDEDIVESARMSTGRSFKGWGPQCKTCGTAQSLKCVDEGHEMAPGDEKFLKFLWDNKHMSPFEQAGMTIEVQAPIFVIREWHRHRTQSYNEMSGRYAQLPNFYYIPSIERIMAGKQSTKNKQGSVEGFSALEAAEIQTDLRCAYADCRDVYEALLAKGVARELARLVIPVAQYSRMRASANLRNWLGFLTLRMDKSAQWEIRQYAKVVGSFVQNCFPRTYELFEKMGT